MCTCAEARLRAALWCCSSRLLSWSRSFARAWPVDRPRVTASSSCNNTYKQPFHTLADTSNNNLTDKIIQSTLLNTIIITAQAY